MPRYNRSITQWDAPEMPRKLIAQSGANLFDVEEVIERTMDYVDEVGGGVADEVCDVEKQWTRGLRR